MVPGEGGLQARGLGVCWPAALLSAFALWWRQTHIALPPPPPPKHTSHALDRSVPSLTPPSPPQQQEEGAAATIKVEGGRTAQRLDSVLEVKQEYQERQEGVLQSTLSWAAAQLLT